MHSHSSAVQNGINEYIEPINREQCKKMHNFGIMYMGKGILLNDLLINSTVTRTFTLAGELNINGKCQGAQFADPYGSWDNVIVQVIAKITLRTSTIPVQLEKNKIMLRSGTVCVFQDETCLDNDDGYTFWKSFPKSTCKFEQYDILFEGIASKITDSLNQKEFPSVFALTTGEITFAFTKLGETPICGYILVGM